MKPMKKETKAKIVTALKFGKIGTFLAPVIALATQYPVIEQAVKSEGGGTLSAIIKMGIIIVFIANISAIKKLASNPSAVVIYGIIFGVCLALKSIIDPLLLVSGVGLGGSLMKEGMDKLIAKLDKSAEVQCKQEERSDFHELVRLLKERNTDVQS